MDRNHLFHLNSDFDLAVERYFAVVHPYEFDTKLTIRKVKVCFANMGSV